MHPHLRLKHTLLLKNEYCQRTEWWNRYKWWTNHDRKNRYSQNLAIKQRFCVNVYMQSYRVKTNPCIAYIVWFIHIFRSGWILVWSLLNVRAFCGRQGHSSVFWLLFIVYESLMKIQTQIKQQARVNFFWIRIDIVFWDYFWSNDEFSNTGKCWMIRPRIRQGFLKVNCEI